MVAGLSVFLVVTQLTSLATARQWVAHSHLVKEATQDLFSAVQDAETGERGYLITQNAHYLEPYNRAIAAIPTDEARLRSLVDDNSDQVKRVDGLSAAIGERTTILQRVVALGQ